MLIGILQTGHAPDGVLKRDGDIHQLFERLLANRGLRFMTFYVVDMEFPDNVTSCDGWLLTGSKHGVYEDHPFIAPLEDFVRKAFDQDIPMVGICFGHQLIAQALGGRVEKFKDGWAVGRQTYNWDGDSVALNAWHQDQVIDAPDGATCIAGNDFCKNAALIYDRKAFTVQPHPEFGSSVIETLAVERGPGVVPDHLLTDAKNDLDAPVESERMADMIASFFQNRTV